MMTVTHLSETERVRRREFVRESKTALQQGQTLEQRTKHRQEKADEWARWLHQKMDNHGRIDPVELLPNILAKVEQTIDDRVAAGIAEVKAYLSGLPPIAPAPSLAVTSRAMRVRASISWQKIAAQFHLFSRPRQPRQYPGHL
jgi:hypothetical protein